MANVSYSLSNFNNDTSCFVGATFDTASLEHNYADCTITTGMLLFLNLTTMGKQDMSFIQAYCINPPDGDDCPFGYCPNSDIAGPLVRIGAYLSNVFLAIQMFYDKEGAGISGAFQAQILTIFSLLFANGISLFRGNLSKLHAQIVVLMVGSPVTFYLWVYVLFALFRKKNRLSKILGPGELLRLRSEHYLPCFFVFSSLIIWLSSICFIWSTDTSRFSQPTCTDHLLANDINFLYGNFPIFIMAAFAFGYTGAGAVLVAPLFLTVIAWVVALVRQWRTIFPEGWRMRHPKPLGVWKTIGKQYPFIHAMSVIVIPTYGWILSVEPPLLFGSHDNDSWGISFGQILSIFIVIPPMLSALPHTRRLGGWFGELSWVQLIRRRCCGGNRRRVQSSTRGAYGRPLLDHQPSSDVPLYTPQTGRAGSEVTLEAVEENTKELTV